MFITRFEKLRGGRILVITEEGIRFPLYRKEIEAYGLQEEQELSADLYEQICREVLRTRAKKRTMYLLQRTDRTRGELRTKLSQDGYPKEIIDEALDYVASYHYVDDFRYACNYIGCSMESVNRAQMLIYLQRKDVDAEIIERAFAEVYRDHEEVLARKALHKRGYDAQKADGQQRQKQYGYLLRKGFAPSVIQKALRGDADL